MPPIRRFPPIEPFVLASNDEKRLNRLFRRLEFGDKIEIKNSGSMTDTVILVDTYSRLIITATGKIIPFVSLSRVNKLPGRSDYNIQVLGSTISLISHLYPQLNLPSHLDPDSVNTICANPSWVIINKPINWDTITPGDEIYDDKLGNSIVIFIDRHNGLLYTHKGFCYTKLSPTQPITTGHIEFNFQPLVSPVLQDEIKKRYPE